MLVMGACASGCGAPAGSATVHLVGRFDAQARFSFAGSRLVARFDGEGRRVRPAETTPNYYDVRVDGLAQPILVTRAGEGLYTVARGLAPGLHDLVLTRRTEAFFGVSRWLGFEGAPL